MFFVVGVNNRLEQLNFRQNIVCPCCGRYSALEAFKGYDYVSLFFVPVFRWNKQYYLRAVCCESTCMIDKDLGRKIEDGTITNVDVNRLNFTRNWSYNQFKRCPSCGYETNEDFVFCPKCGKKF